ncbi:MAG: proton-conducting transporter membrane subunit [Candidatus Omnitrophota bacterium]
MGLFLLVGLPLLITVIVFILKQDKLIKLLCFLTVLVHLIVTLSFWRGFQYVSFNRFLGLDAISQIVLSIISILFFVVSIYLIGYLKEKKGQDNRIFFSCLLSLLAAMTLVTMCRHLGLLWIAVASTTLLSAPLINYYKTPQSIEATWKYLLISSLGIALGLLGTLFLAISAISLKTLFLDDILNNAALLSPSWLKLSVIFLLVGYGTKMGLAPMHTWKPDAYGEAPAPIGALMSGGLTGCVFLAVFRVAQICFHAHLQEFVSPIFILMGILSLFIAAIFITKQKDFNRMLGYSSVEHMGILVLGLGLGGGAIWASLFHAINNAFAKGLLFLVSGNIYQYYRTRKVANIQGTIHCFPLTGTFLILGFFVISAFPPFGMFYSELLILRQAIIARHYLVVLFYVIFLVIIFFGYSKIILEMAFGKPAANSISQEIKKENIFMSMPLIILAMVLVFTGIFIPDSLYSLIDKAAALLGVN